MKKNFRIATMAALSVAALSLSACGESAETGSNSNASSSENGENTGNGAFEIKPAGSYNELDRDQVQDGGELVLPTTEISEQQNAFHGNMTAYTRSIWRMYNPQIALFDGDGTYHANPAYIESIDEEEVDGNLVVKFNIVEEAKFNDGTPIDWTAFETTWKMNNGEDEELVPNSTDGYERILSVEKGDSDKQAVITFDGAYPWWQGLFNVVLHPAVNDAATFNEAYVNEVHPEWGAGPFTIDEFDTQSGTVSFKRNDKWWGEPAKLDKVTYRVMESQATINAFQNGEVDVAGVGTKDNLAKALSMGDKIDIRAAASPSNSLIVLNSQAPKLGDKEVREAIVKGIDRKQIAEIRFNGLDYSEDLPGSLTLYSFQPGYEDNFAGVGSFDAEESKAILEEAGWVEGADGIREKDGEKLSIRYTLLGDSPLSKAFASALQKMMRDIGVELNIQERPSSDFSKVMSEKDFDLFFMGFSSSDPFGVAYFGQTWKSDSELNKSGTGNAELDAKIEELQKLPTADEQIAEANKLEKEAFAEYGLIPMYNGPSIVGVKDGLANFGALAFAELPVENIGWAK
ncbi:ABC transporter substrate-binding protein [Corynebacterium phocae]|uniref:ABC transporter substrate-binding protein n=1 Tax=Corynebacterium phocae TaxID=161895 RepID=A0A1L7D524_9CORY|nr:ABC transporter family substrate-binding protein [Corynebacterium phocae]APT93239.1 ABC transporter substrate-binding protein [Corynebacterium phocae]KAA8721556.1 ABC transporter family substrate-binding protein [Corynebacterium phocae]